MYTDYETHWNFDDLSARERDEATREYINAVADIGFQEIFDVYVDGETVDRDGLNETDFSESKLGLAIVESGYQSDRVRFEYDPGDDMVDCSLYVDGGREFAEDVEDLLGLEELTPSIPERVRDAFDNLLRDYGI